MYDIAGGRERHELLKDAVCVRYQRQAFGSGCRAFNGRRLLVPSGNGYSPDVLSVDAARGHDPLARLACDHGDQIEVVVVMQQSESGLLGRRRDQ
jgi:hypothetical protein